MVLLAEAVKHTFGALTIRAIALTVNDNAVRLDNFVDLCDL